VSGFGFFRTIFFGLVAALAASHAGAASRCQQLAMAVLQTNVMLDASAFEGARRVLVLGDAAPNHAEALPETMTLGTMIAVKVPTATVYSTDIKFEAVSRHRNRITLGLDHTQPLPFEDSFFDRIVMDRGFCMCKSESVSCGGIVCDTTIMVDFLLEVARVLDLNNPSSRAYLEGGYGHTSQTKRQWVEAAKRATAQNPRIKIDMVPNKDLRQDFYGLILKPAQSNLSRPEQRRSSPK
jgi:hypothetical protein